MIPLNTSEIVNKFSRVFGGTDFENSQHIYGCLSSVLEFVSVKPSTLRLGSIEALQEILQSFDWGKALFLRKDPHSWIVRIILRGPDGRYLFVRATLWTICVLQGPDAPAIVVSEFQADGAKLAEEAAKDLQQLLALLRARNPSAPKEVRIAFLSERVYDSLQAVQHFQTARAAWKDIENLEIIVVPEVSIAGSEIVAQALDHPVILVDKTQLAALQTDPDTDFIASFDWHWSSKSTATIENLTRMLRGLKIAPSEKTGGKRLFLSLELEKRIWVEQFEVLLSAVEFLKTEYGFDTVIINGMTAPEGLPKEQPFFEEIARREDDFARDLQGKVSGVAVETTRRMTLKQKISHITSCSYFIAPAGSAALLPILCDVPGICFGTKDFLRAALHLLPEDRNRFNVLDPAEVQLVSGELSVQRYTWAANTPQGQSYSIAPAFFAANLAVHAKAYLGGTIPKR